MKATPILVACLSSMVLLSGLQAATNTVTTAIDQLDDPAGALLSLREAIRDAASGDTIDFDGGLDGFFMVLTKFDFVIDGKDLEIDASALASGGTITFGAAFPSHHFSITNGSTVIINNLTLIDGTSSGQGGALHVSAGSDMTVLNCSLKDNQAEGHGGAIYSEDSNLTLSNCFIQGNSSVSGNGGGLFSTGTNSTLSITETRIEKNRSSGSGGGICNDAGTTLELIDSTVSDNEATTGGGIYNANANLRSSRSTVSYNQAGEHGGGIFLDEGANLSFRNSTASGNRALEGAGMYFAPSSTPTLKFCTVADNTAALRGGGLFSDEATLSLRNSVIAGNSARRGADILRQAGTLTRVGNSLIGDHQSVETKYPAGSPNANGDYAGTTASPIDALLAPLGIYGGFTLSMIPLGNSLLIDNAGATSITTDQRSFLRPVGGSPDIGAVERTLSVVVTTDVDEDDGGLGLGAGDSLREVLLYGLGETNQVVFDPGLDGSTIIFASEIAVTDSVVFIDASALASGIVLEGGNSNRLFNLVSATTLSVHNVTFTKGAPDGIGGAILNQACSLTLDRCTFVDNKVTNPVGIRTGGAILSNVGKLIVHGCSFISNHVNYATSANHGGAISINQGSAAIRNSVFHGNFVRLANEGTGGALYSIAADVLIDGCTFSNNSAGATGGTAKGGAIHAASGNMLLRRSSLVDNLATSQTGAGLGGAVFSQAFVTIVDCVLQNNNASTSAGAASGGGVYHTSSAYLTMVNCTLQGNVTIGAGGAISVHGNAILRHLTVAGANFAENGGGGVKLGGTGNFVTFENCLIAGNATVVFSDGNDIINDSTFTPIVSGPNLIGDNTTVSNEFPAGPLVGIFGAEVDPLLDSLADYGGPTKSMLLLAGSPAIDAGVVTTNTPFTDQRQLKRLRGAAPDLGAYETANETGYDIWTRERIPSGSDTNFTADLEPDQVVNGWEYGQRLDPTNSDSFFFTIGSTTAAEVALDFPYRAQADDLVYSVYSTDNLCQPFTEAFRLDLSTYVATASASNVTFDIDPVAETITYTETVSGSNTQNFFRLVLQHILAP